LYDVFGEAKFFVGEIVRELTGGGQRYLR